MCDFPSREGSVKENESVPTLLVTPASKNNTDNTACATVSPNPNRNSVRIAFVAYLKKIHRVRDKRAPSPNNKAKGPTIADAYSLNSMGGGFNKRAKTKGRLKEDRDAV